MKKFFINAFTLVCTLMACSQAAMAQTAEEVWKQVLESGKPFRVSEVGTITYYSLYDIDGDGVKECFMKTDEGDAYAVYCCGDASGKPSVKAVTEVIASNPPTSVTIHKGTSFVSQQGGCGTGCYYRMFCKMEKSHVVSIYYNTDTYGPEGQEDHDYSMSKPGTDEDRPISKVVWEKSVPKNAKAIVMDDLTWVKVKAQTSKPAAGGSAVAATFHSQSGDTVIIKDQKGYFYQIMSSNHLGVAPGGAYSGDVVIPSAVSYNGTVYPVTTVRRGAMWKKAGASNIGRITSITLPESVTLVGADAFRGNEALKEVKYGKNTRIEVRSFFDCPSLVTGKRMPVFGMTEPFFSDEGSREVFSRMYYPTDEPVGEVTDYQWAVFKYHHNAVAFDKWINMNKDNAMACHAARISNIKAGQFNLKDPSNVDVMFKGYRGYSQSILFAHNDYIASHEFPIFSRYVWGEDMKSMPASFINSVSKKYGRKVKYSYEVAKVLYTSVPEQLVITEFEIVNRRPMVVISWVRNGMEVCWYVMKGQYDVEDPNWGVWNVDDDGTYGIPTAVSIAKDDKGNVELFLVHSAPESETGLYFVQQGNKLILKAEDSKYVWVDAPED